MKSKVVRLYGKNDLRIEEIELPNLKDNEILASVVTDSICQSTWKLVQQGENHKKSPDDLKSKPIVVGHELCGEIIEVGKEWEDKFKPGQKYVIQANLLLEDRVDCVGYSYEFMGGAATHIIIDKDVMDQQCLLVYEGETYFEGSLVEPLSTVVGAFEASYHTEQNTYEHKMGIKESGNMLIMGGTGPMGMLAIDYALNGPKKPKNLIVTGRSEDKINKIRELYSSNEKTKVTILNINDFEDQVEGIKNQVETKFDDIFIMLPNKNLISQASKLLNRDGCVNFFAGPQDKEFTSEINFYDIHYSSTHYVGTSGGNIDDMKKAIKLIEQRKVNVENIITHILGLNETAETTKNLPNIPGGKKLVYTQKKMPLMDLENLDSITPLNEILKKSNGLWNKEAEDFILATAQNI